MLIEKNSVTLESKLRSFVTPLDRLTVVAFFAIYGTLPEETRFGVIANKVFPQLSQPVKIFNMELFNVQSGIRTWNGNDRNEALEFIFAIQDALKWYSHDVSFRLLLPDLEKGIGLYATSYKTLDIATQCFLFMQADVNRAINSEAPKKEDNSQVKLNELEIAQQTIRDFWKPEDIKKLLDDIALAKTKQTKNDIAALIEPILLYLDKRQDGVKGALLKEQELLKKTQGLS